MQFEKSSQTNSTPVFSLTKRQRSSNRKEGCKAFGLSGANDPVIKKVQMNGGGGGLCRRVSNAKRLFLLVSCRLERILRPPLPPFFGHFLSEKNGRECTRVHHPRWTKSVPRNEGFYSLA